MSEGSIDRPRPWWSNPWWRALVVHPVGFVGVWVALCLVIAALPRSEFGDVAWGFWIIPLSAVASAIATGVMVARRPRPAGNRFLLMLVGLLTSGLAGYLGLLGWIVAANHACHGAYECPF